MYSIHTTDHLLSHLAAALQPPGSAATGTNVNKPLNSLFVATAVPGLNP